MLVPWFLHPLDSSDLFSVSRRMQIFVLTIAAKLFGRSKPSAALSASVSHDLDRAEKQLLLERSFVGRREEVKGSALTFGGVCPGSFTMPWKHNTVCDIYRLWWSVDTVLQ